jgi:hypothetical protein
MRALNFKWTVNYLGRRGKVQQTTVDATSHRGAIAAARAAHPKGRDFTAIRLSARPR